MAVVQPIRQQTQDLAAERAVLGAVLGDNTVLASVAALGPAPLQPSDGPLPGSPSYAL